MKTTYETMRNALEAAGFECGTAAENRRALPYPPGHCWHLTPQSEAVDDGRRCPSCTQLPCTCTGTP